MTMTVIEGDGVFRKQGDARQFVTWRAGKGFVVLPAAEWLGLVRAGDVERLEWLDEPRGVTFRTGVATAKAHVELDLTTAAIPLACFEKLTGSTVVEKARVQEVVFVEAEIAGESGTAASAAAELGRDRVVLAFSRVLDEEIVLVPRADDPVPEEWAGRVVYAVEELARIGAEKWTPEHIRQLHTAKSVFRGSRLVKTEGGGAA